MIGLVVEISLDIIPWGIIVLCDYGKAAHYKLISMR